MSLFLDWFKTLNAKSSRLDVWVFLIAITFLLSLTVVYFMSIGLLKYDKVIMELHLSWIEWFLLGMFIDLGIYSLSDKLSFLRGKKSKDKND